MKQPVRPTPALERKGEKKNEGMDYSAAEDRHSRSAPATREGQEQAQGDPPVPQGLGRDHGHVMGAFGGPRLRKSWEPTKWGVQLLPEFRWTKGTRLLELVLVSAAAHSPPRVAPDTGYTRCVGGFGQLCSVEGAGDTTVTAALSHSSPCPVLRKAVLSVPHLGCAPAVCAAPCAEVLGLSPKSLQRVGVCFVQCDSAKPPQTKLDFVSPEDGREDEKLPLLPWLCPCTLICPVSPAPCPCHPQDGHSPGTHAMTTVPGRGQRLARSKGLRSTFNHSDLSAAQKLLRL